MTSAVQTWQTEPYTYKFDNGDEIVVCTDPAGLWHAGVSATVWDASLVLAKHFEKICLSESYGPSNRIEKILKKDSIRTLELGAGCSALPSLVLSRLLTNKYRRGKQSSIVISDKQEALPLLRKTLKSQQESSGIELRTLDWTCGSKIDAKEEDLDLLVMADLLAFPDLYEPLMDTILSICTKDTTVYLAYERRDFAVEIDFFQMWGKAFKFEMVPEQELHDQWRAPGEIYLYRGWLR